MPSIVKMETAMEIINTKVTVRFCISTCLSRYQLISLSDVFVHVSRSVG